MPQYIVDLWLDGYDTESEMEKACDEFIYEQLNFTASSVRVKRSDYAALLARHNALVEAVAWERECDEFLKSKTYSFFVAWGYLQSARAEVDRLIATNDCKGERR